MNICIAGKNDISANALEYAYEKLGPKKLFALPNQNDSGIHKWNKSLRKTAIEKQIRIINSIEELYNIENLIFISLEYDKIISVKKFQSSRLYNIHFSLLPRYKGVYTSALHILNYEKIAGVTLHLIDDGIDTGDIIDQIPFYLDKFINCRELYFLFNKYGLKLFKKNFMKLISKKVTYVKKPQSAFHSSYYSKSSINYKNLRIDLLKTAFEIDAHIRAFYFPEYQIPEVHDYPIEASTILSERSFQKPGSLLKDNSSYIVISTIDFNLKLIKYIGVGPQKWTPKTGQCVKL